MPTPKFKKQYDDMLKVNSALFESLKTLDKNSEEFKEAQRKALRIARKHEDMLCSKTENTHFSNFSTNLADKFWELIRTHYPEIDFA
jgi:hypothetical protein